MYRDLTKRIIALALSVCMIAGMVDLSGLTVRAEEPEPQTIIQRARIVVDDSGIIYDGTAKVPEPSQVTVYDMNNFDEEGNPLPVDCEYILLPGRNNINAGENTASVIVQNANDENDKKEGFFSIKKRNITDGVTHQAPEDLAQWIISRDDVEGLLDEKLKLQFNGGELKLGTDYKLSYKWDENDASTKESWETEVTVTGMGNYTGDEEPFKFQVTLLKPEKLTFSFEGNYKNGTGYDGYQQKPTVKDVKYAGERLDGIEFITNYQNNTKAGMAHVWIEITSEGKYNKLTSVIEPDEDENKDHFFMIRKQLDGNIKEYKNINNIEDFPDGKKDRNITVDTIPEQSYSGLTGFTLKEGDLKVWDPDHSEQLKMKTEDEDGDYTIECWINPDDYDKNTGQGTGRVKITAVKGGRYTGDRTETFKVSAPELTDGMADIDDSEFIYDIEEDNKEKQWYDEAVKKLTVDGYTEDDYKVEPVGTDYGTSAGEHWLRVTAKAGGKLKAGTFANVSYNVQKRSLTDRGVKFEDISNTVFNGDKQCPKLKLTYTSNSGGKMDLKEYTDYTPGYGENKNVKTGGLAWAEGKGNFEGKTEEKTFSILPIDLKQAEQDGTLSLGFKTGTEYPYTGKEITISDLDMRYGATVLKNETDYTIHYIGQSTDVGRVEFTIEGIDNYIGDITGYYFKIVPLDLTTSREVSYPKELGNVIYTGEKLMPEVPVTHNGKTLRPGVDYILDYGDEYANTERGEGKITITGQGNYKGTDNIKFTIAPRDFGSGTLIITHQGEDAELEPEDPKHFHTYTGDKIEIPLKVEFSFVPDGNDGTEPIKRTLREGVDYTCSSDNDTDVGTATVKITANTNGNYSGSCTVAYGIKGNLRDDNFVKVLIPNQTYTHEPITPTDAKVIFKLKSGKENELVLGKDYVFSNFVNNENAYQEATAIIEGIKDEDGDYCGNYYDKRQVSFNIVPFDLSLPNPDGNEYLVEMDEEYTFCDTDKPIRPEPTVMHNGHKVPCGIQGECLIDYPTDDSNSKVGEGKLTIKSNNNNYKGKRDVTFKINPYVIGDEENNPTSQIQVTGIRDVVVDDVLDHPENNTDVKIKSDGSVEMSNLQVMYTPVDWKGDGYEPRALRDDECTVTYKNNDTIGTATITIEGKGNFNGTITETFRIRGDLSSPRTKVLPIDNCVYSPKGNEPVPVVEYTYNDREKVILDPEDYTVKYENHENATLGGEKAKVIINPAYEEDGITPQNYVQSDPDQTASREFVIEQRDLAKAIEMEGSEKDPSLNVEVDGKKIEVDRIEDVYEYTGSDIEPLLQITCDGEAVTAGANNGSGDYKIKFDYNRNVYTFAEGENDEQDERLMPTITVEATNDGDDNYTGNYKGRFTLKFEIIPREISKDTISTVLWVDSKKYTDSQIPEVDYNNGEAIWFPEDPDDPLNTKSNMIVTWSKQGQNEVELEEGTDYLVRYDKNRRIGEAEIIIEGLENGNYSVPEELENEKRYKRTFKIMASIEEVDKEEPQYMTLKEGYEKVPYGIVAVYPKLEFIDVSGGSEDEKAYILEEGKDFEIVTTANQGISERVSRNNINVRDKNDEEPPTVVIRGIGCYRGEIERTYSIVPKDLTTDDGDIRIEFVGALNTENYENAFIYSGQAIEPVVNVYNHDQLMEKGKDYIVRYRNNTAISTETQKASVVVEAVQDGNYTGQKTFYYNIIKRPIEEMTVTITSGAQVYSRRAKTPEVEVSYVENSQRKVLDKSNYDVAYENNINAAAESAGEDAPTIVITGKDSYGGTIRKTFTIAPEPLDESNDDFVITSKNVEYTGLDMTTEITVKAKDGTLLEEEKDYVITGYKNNKNAGTGYATIRGNGNYTGTRDVPFRIIAPDVSNRFRISDITDQIYTGSPIEPQVSVAVAEGESEIPLTSDEYELEYENNTNVGTASVIVRGTGNYGGAKRVTFKITPKSIGAEGIMAADMLLADIEDQLYTGRGVTPDVSLTRRGQTGQADELLVLGKDYTLSYLTNVAVGIASVNIIGIGNYTGNIQKQFRILGPMNLADVAKINTQPYTGSAVTPEPNVSYAGKKLTKGEDYTLVYEDNVTQGTAKITITGQGMYTGEKIVTFEIARDFSNETIVKGMAAAYTYTGKAIKPVVLVEDHGRILSNGTDFKVSYSNNINVGTATVTVTGVGAYSGTASAQFKITPQNIGRAAVSKVADQTYDGKDKKPSVSVSSDGIALKNGTDYTVVHVDNKNPGKASVVIKGKGNFTGTQTVNYNIIVPKVTGVKVSGYTDTTITFSWKRNKVVTGYEIYNSKNKRVARVKKNSIVEATVSNLKAGSTETFRVRAYVTRGQYYYSDFVSIKAGTAPKATRITSITSSKSKQVELKWKKVAGATQYQVYRSTSKNGKYKKIATTKKTSYTDKKATGGKTYYYQIRVGKKNGSKTYYSYSKVKSVAAKK